MIHYRSTSILELIESSGIIDTALVTNPPSKLSKINDVTTNTTLITEDPSDESNHRKGTNDPVCNTGKRVWVLHVSPDGEVWSFGIGESMSCCCCCGVVAKKKKRRWGCELGERREVEEMRSRRRRWWW